MVFSEIGRGVVNSRLASQIFHNMQMFNSEDIYFRKQKITNEAANKARSLCCSISSVRRLRASKPHVSPVGAQWPRPCIPHSLSPSRYPQIRSEDSAESPIAPRYWSPSSPITDLALYLFPNSNQGQTINHSSRAQKIAYTDLFEFYHLLLKEYWTLKTWQRFHYNLRISYVTFFVVLSQNNQ